MLNIEHTQVRSSIFCVKKLHSLECLQRTCVALPPLTKKNGAKPCQHTDLEPPLLLVIFVHDIPQFCHNAGSPEAINNLKLLGWGHRVSPADLPIKQVLGEYSLS